MFDLHSPQRVAAIAASALVTVGGGAMDAWVYLAHGHVFATAQTGNVVMTTVALAGGDLQGAGNHLSSVVAFVAGVLLSRASGDALKRAKLNSRDVRLGIECVLLAALALVADAMPDRAVTACIGFIAGVQITSLSHIGTWSFNTGMTTGNLRGALSALVKAVDGSEEEWPHALAIGVLCAAFAVGALLGGWLTPRLGRMTLLPVAGLVAVAIAVAPRKLDPIPGWDDLR